MGFGHFLCFASITREKGNNNIWNGKPGTIQPHFRGNHFHSVICQNCKETKSLSPVGSKHIPPPHELPPTTACSCLARHEPNVEGRLPSRRFLSSRHQALVNKDIAALVSAGGGSRRPGAVPKNLQRSKGKLTIECTFIPDMQYLNESNKTSMAKRSTKVRSCPASQFLPSLLTLSQQDHAPCWKPQVRASQSPREGSVMVLEASSSTRHTPCRLRPGNRRTENPGRAPRAQTRRKEGKKQHSGLIRALQPMPM